MKIVFSIGLTCCNGALAQNRYPAGDSGKTVRPGEAFVIQTSTQPLTAPIAGNALQRTSCQLPGVNQKATASA